MGWPFCLAEMRREFQTGENFFAPRCRHLFCVLTRIVVYQLEQLEKLAQLDRLSAYLPTVAFKTPPAQLAPLSFLARRGQSAHFLVTFCVIASEPVC